jgi:large subunit ribosomal protein L2
MGVRQFKPVTKSSRFRSVSDFAEITRTTPEKSLLEPLKKSGGRDNHGHIAMRRIGGGHKRMYRVIDFKRNKHNMPATVLHIEYDPNRSARIALVQYEDGEKRYILHPKGLSVGDKIVSGPGSDTRLGNTIPLREVPLGTDVHNVELKPGKGGQIARAAGTYVQVVGRDRGMVIVRLNSGEQRYVRTDCMATVGAVSNPDNQNQTFAKAGRTRWMGKRPLTRGVAKNPVDHPHGGGEGRTSGGRHPVTPWGKPTKGARTRHNKATDKFIIRSRHAKKKG